MQELETTQPPSRIDYIDGFRGLAVMAVVLFHSGIWAQLPHNGGMFKTLAVGRAGVGVFLVLSGFCLFYPLIKRGGPVLKLDLGDYLRRRLRRIVPPYYVALIGMALTLSPTYGRAFEVVCEREPLASSVKGRVLAFVFAFAARCDRANGRLGIVRSA